MNTRAFIVNSFPRCGSHFLSQAINLYQPIFTKIIDGVDYEDLYVDRLQIHLPQILDNKDLMTVSVIREPYEALASLIYMANPVSVSGLTDATVDRLVGIYMDFIEGIDKAINNENFMLLNFEDLTNSPVNTIQSIFDKFYMLPNDSITFTDEELAAETEKVLSELNLMNKYDGHMPRKKDPIRNSLVLHLKSDFNLFVDPLVVEYNRLKNTYLK